MRLAGVVAVAVAAVVFAPSAFAASSPELDVIAYSTTLNRVSDTEIDFIFPATAPAPARFVLSVPSGYAIAPAMLGATVASVDADVVVGGATKHVNGNVVADDPARYATNTCAPGSHSAVWTIFLTVEGQPYVIPLFVDSAGTAAAYTVEACLLSPDVPVAAGGAPSGARITYLALDFVERFTNPSAAGFHRWSALVTPFAGGTATPNIAAAYELRSIVPLPESLTLKARYDKKTRGTVITGKLLTVGKAENGVSVDVYGAASIFGDFRKLGSAKTNKQGVYTLRKRLTTSLWITPYVGIYAGACEVPASAAPAGCAFESYSPVFGNLVRALVPKKK